LKIASLVVDSDELVGQGGFLAIRRLRLRNRREDGSFSAPYVSDAVIRPYGQDAVVVVIYTRDPIRVLVRDGLRPTVALVRNPDLAPIPEPAPSMFVTELVAGILEANDSLADRAAAETLEEAGFVVEPAAITALGAAMYASAGSLPEKEYFVAVEVDPGKQHALAGDGSAMEEGATTRWLDLDDAIAACVRGDIVDMKTELGLRRLRDRLT
jgi:ADP-ribose pyrophosphatase